MSKIGIDAPISLFVGIGQGTSRDVASDAGMIKFGVHRAKTGFDVSKAFSIGQLSKCHAEELIEAREGSEAVVTSIPSHTFVEFVSWQEIHELRENVAPTVHWPFLSSGR